MDINISLSCDDKYAKYAGVVISSILHNSNLLDNYNFYILDGNISEGNKEKFYQLNNIRTCNINFINIDPQLFEVYSNIKTHNYISVSTYYRLKLAELLPSIDKVLYLDCDVIVNTDLANLYNIDIENYVCAGVNDLDELQVANNKTYVNAGVLLFNLSKIRDENIEEEFSSYTISNIDRIKLGDQEIINEVLKGRIKLLPATWNVQVGNFMYRSSYIPKPNIIHYIGFMKPWVYGSWAWFKDYYYKYLKISPWGIDEAKRLKKLKFEYFIGFWKHFMHRPFFFLNPRFFRALLKTCYYKFIN